jgi:hypothetical protein
MRLRLSASAETRIKWNQKLKRKLNLFIQWYEHKRVIFVVEYSAWIDILSPIGG